MLDETPKPAAAADDLEMDIITYVDEDGDEYDAALVAVIEVDGQEFAVLSPVDQLEDEDEDDVDIVLFHYFVDEEDTISLEPIEDDELFDKVREAAMMVFGEGEPS